jgi:hypothetical protein
MGLPADNAAGYREGSPVYAAQGLRDTQQLLIVHGTGDDNCHYATTEVGISLYYNCITIVLLYYCIIVLLYCIVLYWAGVGHI